MVSCNNLANLEECSVTRTKSPPDVTGLTWTTVNGAVPEATADTKLTVRATTLMVSWNCTNFWMLANTLRPQRTT